MSARWESSKNVETTTRSSSLISVPFLKVAGGMCGGGGEGGCGVGSWEAVGTMGIDMVEEVINRSRARGSSQICRNRSVPHDERGRVCGGEGIEPGLEKG